MATKKKRTAVKQAKKAKKTAKPKKGSKPARPSSKPRASAKPAKKKQKDPKVKPKSKTGGQRPAPLRVAAPETLRGRPPKRPPTIKATSQGVARTPEGAEELKAKIGALATATGQIRSLKRSLNRSFYDIGQILREIKERKLYEVKGYGSFDAFLEREIDLGKLQSLRIVRIVQTFLKEAALKAGLERVSAALEALEGEEEQGGGAPPATTTSSGTRSPIPYHKQ